MQTDMHYYGTYAMARCAGLREDIARAIATAAEYVDDSDRLSITLADGEVIESEPTAHHPENKANLDPNDQRRTWVPFHFIPGNSGKDDAEKLACQTDSEIARQMVDRNIELAGEPFGVLLMGITAHVYADTFSHYGFSGISSYVNHVKIGSIEFDPSHGAIQQTLHDKVQRFIDAYVKGPFADSISKLGHGGVATFPDQPFLKWRFTYGADNRDSGWRDNQKTFLLACEKLHSAFIRFGEKNDGEYVDQGTIVHFDDIRPVVSQILAVEAEEAGRIDAWQLAAESGKLYRNKPFGPIPQYDPSTFINDLKALPTLNLEKARDTLVYTFLQAAKNHRAYVLEQLLPGHGITVSSSPIDWIGQV